MIVALGAAFASFEVRGGVSILAVALVAGLVGMRRGLPLPLVVAASAAAGSALIHFAVAPEHFEEWWGFGLFFVVCGQVQMGWALALGRAHSGWMLAIGIVGSLILVLVWGLSRTAGLPFGPEPGTPEPVSIPDVVSAFLELVTAWPACGGSLRGAGSARGHRNPGAGAHAAACDRAHGLGAHRCRSGIDPRSEPIAPRRRMHPVNRPTPNDKEHSRCPFPVRSQPHSPHW